jgi:hypothetical protein
MNIFEVIKNTKEGENFEFICMELFENHVKLRYQYYPKYHINFFVRLMKNGVIDLDPGFYREDTDSYSITSAHAGSFGYKARIWKDSDNKFWHKGPAHLLTSSFDTIEECLNSIYSNTITFLILGKNRSKKTEEFINKIMGIEEKDLLNILISDYLKENRKQSADKSKILDIRSRIEETIIELSI